MTKESNRLSKQPLGYWLFIRNEEDAKYAVKMAGLPIFLNGLSYFVFAVLDIVAYWLSVSSDEAIPNFGILSWLSLFTFIFGIYFVYSGLRVRNKTDYNIKTAFIILCIAYLISFVARLFLLSYVWSVYHIVFITFGILPLLLVYGGLRGQKWLKKNSASPL